MIQWLIVLLALLVLNSLWFSSRFLFLIPLQQQPKSILLGMLEVLMFYFILGVVSRYAESQSMGNIAHQGWEFYAITICLTLVFAAPGFIIRVLWK